MMSFLNRAKMTVSGTPGTGSITLNASVSQFATFAEAGAVNGGVYTYAIDDGNDFEIGQGTYSSSGPTLSRDTVYLSKISGVAGTTKLTLTTNATVAITLAKEDLPNLGAKKADQQVFTSSGTWTKPSGFSSKAYVFIQCWGPGGGGDRRSGSNQASGAGGGGYNERWVLLSSLGSTESVTVPAGGLGRTGSTGDGADGGGNTTFGSWLTAYYGGGANQTTGGLGGSFNAPKVADSTMAGWSSMYFRESGGRGGQFGSAGPNASAFAGGGGGASTGNSPGTSVLASPGSTPGAGTPTKAGFAGGGCGSNTANTNGGDGGDGKCVVTLFDGA